jgi:hypothetical protein
MPAKSEQQQKLFGLALSVKRGETPRSEASDEVLNIVDTMSEKQIEDFAKTSHKGIPKKVEQTLREIIREEIQRLNEGKLEDIIKKHINQYSLKDDADYIAKDIGRRYGWNKSQVMRAETIIRKRWIK